MLGRILPWLGVIALLVAAVVTAGWGAGPTGGPPSRRTPTPSSTPVVGPTSLSAAEAHSLVRNLALARRDLPTGFTPGGRRDGYRLSMPSLDLCGSRFESERFRLAARRVTFGSPTGRGRIHHVVVAYEHGYAEQALAELEAAAPRCSRVVRPGRQEQPDTLALRVRTTPRAGLVRHDLVVERRGDVLSLLQVDARQGYLTLALARRLGNRLEAQQPVA